MLIDQLIHHTVCTHPEDTSFAENLANACRFQINNVASHVRDNTGSPSIPVPYRIQDHIPNVAPLAPIMWFEYEGLAVGESFSSKSGCLIYIEYDSAKHKIKGDELFEHVRWGLRSECFMKQGQDVFVYPWIDLIGVDKDGQILRAPSIENHRWGLDYTHDETQRGVWTGPIICALTAICFAHCKGAEVKEHQPSRQVRRAAERKKEPVYSYRTIDIGPASRVLKEEGDIATNGLGKALHICRGHFANYTAEKPLFGKYVGTVYKPMHLRGKAENGIAAKDYRVHAETTTS